MTTSERIAFLEARSKGLGGSDAASLLQHIIPDTKYSCRRRLFYEKSQHPRDFERTETGPMKLGNILEPVLCEEFSKLTGRRIEVVGQQKHPDFPEMVGHVDRMQYTPEKEGPGCLECKALGTRIFYQAKREGLATEYLLQLQWYLCVTNSTWGSFVIGNRDNLALIHFDVERDQNICDALLREAPAFWASIGNPEAIPERREPDSFVCQSCEYRITCQGPSLLPASEDGIPTAPELAPFAAEYIERKKMSDEAAELVAETKEIIMLMLGDKQAVQVPVGDKLRPVYFRPQAGKPLYAQCVKDMGAQYNVLRDKLIQISTLINDPNARNVDGTLQALVAGAELVPPPSSFIKTGKSSRPLLLQFLDPKAKEEE